MCEQLNPGESRLPIDDKHIGMDKEQGGVVIRRVTCRALERRRITTPTVVVDFVKQSQPG